MPVLPAVTGAARAIGPRAMGLLRATGRGAARAGGGARDALAARGGVTGLGGAAARKTGNLALQTVFGVGRHGWKNRSPAGKAAILGGGAVFGLEAWDVATEEEFGDAIYGTEKEQLLKQHMMARYSRASKLVENAKRKQAMEALMRLASADPHLYNEVVAGKRLPQGAMVLGGSPRYDLMETLAYDLVDGRYPAQPDPENQLLQLLRLQGTQ